MTFEQGTGFALIAVAVAMFAWGRFRYDLIALGILLAAMVTGVVKADDAFSGFASEVVVIIASALVISAAIAKSGVIEPILRPMVARLKRPATQVPVLAGATALLSMMFKNVGALATLMPVAIRLGRGKESSPTALLMPMSFVSLLGGLVTLVGTSTNIIASDVREQMTGKPFALFDFAPVGLALTAVGLLFVSFAWRLLPMDRAPKAGIADVVADTAYSTEAVVPDEGMDDYRCVADLDLGGHGITLTGIVGADGKAKTALPSVELKPGMVLILEATDEALGGFFQRVPLTGSRASAELAKGEASEEVRTIEAVVEPRSQMVGQSAASLALERRYDTRLLAVSRHGTRIRERLPDVRFQPGDLLLLQAAEGQLPVSLTELGALPLAERDVAFGTPRHRYGPVLITLAAMVVVALKILPVAEAFFGAAFLMVAIGSLSIREAYGALEPEVLVLIGALTPLSHALQDNGATALVAQQLTPLLSESAPIVVIGGLMLMAMACSPFLHNAPTVLVLAPIGVLMAQRLGFNPDAALMAVATGAGCDFVTPVGHQCNTLVRGPGGYRFGDYIRLGAPLSVVVLLLGTVLIGKVWL